MSGKYNIRAGYIAYPPLRHDMIDPYDFMMNRKLSEIVMNGGTGMWAEPIIKGPGKDYSEFTIIFNESMLGSNGCIFYS